MTRENASSSTASEIAKRNDSSSIPQHSSRDEKIKQQPKHHTKCSKTFVNDKCEENKLNERIAAIEIGMMHQRLALRETTGKTNQRRPLLLYDSAKSHVVEYILQRTRPGI
ncbi:hypothetical protein KIN20_035862 [Parelaphostrongylus tenuis]|uniref:Uncharacterized protein n=1 Tax=Parelaphostrongylus tenuis TaxID=148309 RepID=A0AAD5WKT5_PARTN|nr:hypothetical protein KIN20_035862 [Parelaphostrongylus tenuis]